MTEAVRENGVHDGTLPVFLQQHIKDGVIDEFTAYREYIHVREHAVLALIPLLQYFLCPVRQ